jgi:hypothetical protein
MIKTANTRRKSRTLIGGYMLSRLEGLQRLSMFGTVGLLATKFKRLLLSGPPSAECVTDSGVPSATGFTLLYVPCHALDRR